MQTLIKKADFDVKDEVFSLYRSLVGTKGCVWDDEYPSLQDVTADINNGSLYILCGESGEIIGAASAVKDDEQEALDCWNKKVKNPCEISRVCVKKEWQHKGLAKKLISHLEKQIADSGFDGIRLLAFKENESAVMLYKALGYKIVGEAQMYDIGAYWCFEKEIF